MLLSTLVASEQNVRQHVDGAPPSRQPSARRALSRAPAAERSTSSLYSSRDPKLPRLPKRSASEILRVTQQPRVITEAKACKLVGHIRLHQEASRACAAAPGQEGEEVGTMDDGSRAAENDDCCTCVGIQDADKGSLTSDGQTVRCPCDCHRLEQTKDKLDPEELEEFTCDDCKHICFVMCPPVPSRIVKIIAFHPPEPTYNFIPIPGQEKEAPRRKSIWRVMSCSSGDDHEKSLVYDLLLKQTCFELKASESVTPFKVRTSRGHNVACVMLSPGSPQLKYTMIYSHGNAEDLGLVIDYAMNLCRVLSVNVVCYDYAGYGISSGQPSEKNLYADIRSVFEGLVRRGVRPQHVIVHGFSIGTVPTVDLASKMPNLGGVILQAPLTSGLRVLFPQRKSRGTLCFDPFPSIDKVSKVKAPVLVIHGTSDEVISLDHGKSIYERCKLAVPPLWLPGCGHDIWSSPTFVVLVKRIDHFIREELANLEKLTRADAGNT